MQGGIGVYNLFELLEFPLIQCTQGLHFVCRNCFDKIGNHCPACKTNRLFRNRLLEKELVKVMSNCTNFGCSEKLFPWLIDRHIEKCPYTKSKCFYCEDLISLNSIVDHIKSDGCNDTNYVQFTEAGADINYVQFTETGADGNATLVVEALNSSDVIYETFPVDSDSMCLIYEDQIIMLKKLITYGLLQRWT